MFHVWSQELQGPWLLPTCHLATSVSCLLFLHLASTSFWSQGADAQISVAEALRHRICGWKWMSSWMVTRCYFGFLSEKAGNVVFWPWYAWIQHILLSSLADWVDWCHWLETPEATLCSQVWNATWLWLNQVLWIKMNQASPFFSQLLKCGCSASKVYGSCCTLGLSFQMRSTPVSSFPSKHGSWRPSDRPPTGTPVLLAKLSTNGAMVSRGKLKSCPPRVNPKIIKNLWYIPSKSWYNSWYSTKLQDVLVAVSW